ncbi:MAG: hypothetical protein GY943_09220, partial [Chloroflexi bacterium]|nr:hypothetical protein [Chloroflexota bacterium]
VQGHAEAAWAVFTAVNDQTGIAAALALLGVSSHDQTAIPHFKQALQIATSLSALPLIFDVLFNLAVWHKKQNHLTEAWRIVRFIGGQETAVSAHVHHRTNQLHNDLLNLTADAIPDMPLPQNLEQFLQTLNL